MKSFRLLILVAVLLALLFFSGWIGFHSFIHSDLFREWLSKRVSRSIRVNGQLEPLTWEGSSFRSAGFSAKGTGKGKLRTLEITNLSAQFDWWQLLKGAWVINQVDADKVVAAVGKRPNETASAESPKHPPGFSLSNLLPSELRIEHLYIASANLHWETDRGDTGQLVGAKISATRGGPDRWDVEATGGNARHAAYPELHVEQVHAVVSQNSIEILAANAQTAGARWPTQTAEQFHERPASVMSSAPNKESAAELMTLARPIGARLVGFQLRSIPFRTAGRTKTKGKRPCDRLRSIALHFVKPPRLAKVVRAAGFRSDSEQRQRRLSISAKHARTHSRDKVSLTSGPFARGPGLPLLQRKTKAPQLQPEPSTRNVQK